ncbi:MAG: hypothetical protein GXY87_01060 [Tissierellia bacterium]|nr:hypothetical protein [Tissierellia bacterium]
MKVKVCMGTSCVMNGAMHLYDQLISLNDLIDLNPEQYNIESLEVEALKCTKVCKKTENYKNCVVYVDDELISDMKTQFIVEHIMSIIKK